MAAQPQTQPPTLESNKSASVTAALCILFGILGIHRFYVGKIGTGILMLLTLGGLGIWLLVDIVLIVNNKFEDKNDNLLILTQKPSSLKKAIVTIGSVIAAFIMYAIYIVALVFYLTSGVVNVVYSQLDALRANDLQKAYSYTSKDFQKVTSFDDFKKFLDQHPSLKNNKSAFFNKRSIENNTGYVYGTLTAEDGAKTPVEYHLIYEEGGWKILGITVLVTGAGIETESRGNSS